MNRDAKACPVCGFEYVHPIEVQVNSGGLITTVDSLGTDVVRGEQSGRGVRVCRTFDCESGHRWTEAEQFHKGQTFVTVEIERGEDNELSDDDDGRLATIWRN